MTEFYTETSVELAYEGFKPETVSTVTIPRTDYLKAIHAMLEAKIAVGDLSTATAKQLRKVARTQQRFPMATWISARRGCGCLVGEYLVASEQVAEIAKLQQQDARKVAAGIFAGGDYYSVEERLKLDFGDDLGNELAGVGAAADTAVETLVYKKCGTVPDVVLIED